MIVPNVVIDLRPSNNPIYSLSKKNVFYLKI